MSGIVNIIIFVLVLLFVVVFFVFQRKKTKLKEEYKKIEAEKEFTERYAEMGVDFNEPEDIQWNLDSNEGEFTQTQGTLSGQVDEFENFREYSFTVDDGNLMDVEMLSFSDRIDQLIKSGEFDEAKKTVEFAKVADESEQDVNLYFLKIYAAEGDKNSFEEILNEIQPNIDDYAKDTQDVIEQLQKAIGY